MHTAQNGNDSIVQTLIEAGADVNSRDGHGNTALMFAAQKGYLKCVKLLLQKGANLSYADIDNMTAVMKALASAEVRL